MTTESDRQHARIIAALQRMTSAANMAADQMALDRRQVTTERQFPWEVPPQEPLSPEEVDTLARRDCP